MTPQHWQRKKHRLPHQPLRDDGSRFFTATRAVSVLTVAGEILHAGGNPEMIPSATMKRKASAVWQGGLKDGRGIISTESGVLSDVGYSFARRFEGEPGTNPEELIAAAHASCFSMALSAQLGEAGLTPQRIETAATVTLEKLPDGFAVTASHLNVNVTIPGADEGKFNEAAKRAKEGCPISKLLNAKITMDARLNPGP